MYSGAVDSMYSGQCTSYARQRAVLYPSHRSRGGSQETLDVSGDRPVSPSDYFSGPGRGLVPQVPHCQVHGTPVRGQRRSDTSDSGSASDYTSLAGDYLEVCLLYTSPSPRDS